MNSLLKTGIIAAVIALVVSGVFWAVSPSKQAPMTLGNTSTDGSQSNLPNPSNYDYLVSRLALGFGTNLSNSNTGVGNVNIEAQKMNLVAATTTPCAIQNPFNATSTLQEATMNVTTATSTAASFQIATSTTAFANTSPFFGATLAANAQGTFMAGETASSSGLGVVIPPTAWVVITLTSANTLGGTCSALFVTP